MVDKDELIESLVESLEYLLYVSKPFHRPTDKLGWGAIEMSEKSLKKYQEFKNENP